ncbi:citrate lyase subunit gamma (acyl carrier protein) [Anaerosolibacter carboniphilus]|uniref:Citrate lyase subunit gamma (Acyl carrier protein) n=1 Tax=Anaerosolibacter carboniphilus TaxID=1417629 RepID=A0A841KP71_9FIRM|nr:citrate lyase subunit gamma [Anaerosolibacter carboniphilus]MBB6215237.1 citrate lyase subunit gamma (acyl carrier protein) [Anaerosolibacter carboniphilus]
MVGIAGHENAQDCLVKVTLKDEGGLNIKISSKLKKLFERYMMEAVMTAARELNVENADIEVLDLGSLDFVIKARVKTAIKRAKGAAYGEKA